MFPNAEHNRLYFEMYSKWEDQITESSDHEAMNKMK